MMTLKGFLTTAGVLAILLVLLGLSLVFPKLWSWAMGNKPNQHDY